MTYPLSDPKFRIKRVELQNIETENSNIKQYSKVVYS